ncbi:MAG: serine/threonine protein kinase [Alphaproteobacteria bacterium]|nr:serine/threonine protein kinase [Alphaproteobacteria bacterium]
MSATYTMDLLLDGASGDAEAFVQRPSQTLRAQPDAEADTEAALQRLGEGGVTLKGTLGQGGMAIVHLGLQESVDREVAVKTLREDPGDAKARFHLLREAWITGGLEHPNIVPVHDVREGEGGAPQILLKRIQGDSWAELLTDPVKLDPYLQGAEPLNWHVRTLVAVCNAVDFAHSRGVLHRDIKPENVMVGAFGEVTLLDWGVAARMNAEGRVPPPKGRGHIVGTPAYLAPEMVGRQPHVPATDVYLLGAVLHELLTGHPPHQGDSLDELLACLLRPPELPLHPLSDLCRRALSVEPSSRPSVRHFRQELERYLELGAVEELVDAASLRLSKAEEKILRDADEQEVVEDLISGIFGLTQALELSPGHARARARLDEGAHVAARWALRRGEVGLAAFQLRRAEHPDPELLAEIETAVAEQTERDARLAALQRDLDPTLGLKARRMASFALLGSATLLSVFMTLSPTMPGYLEFSATSAALLLLMALFRWRFRDQVFLNAYNRKLGNAVFAVPALQLVVDFGGWARGWPSEETHALLMIVALAVFGGLGTLLDGRFWRMALVWGALWLISPLWPERVYVLHGVGTLSTVVLMFHMLSRRGLGGAQADSGSSTTAVP